MNFSLIYITIIRLGLYVRMYKYIVQHNFNSSPSHPHSPRWQIYKNPKIERKKHKENKNMDITNEWFVFFARAIWFFFLRGIVCIDIVEPGKKNRNHYCSCGKLDVTSVSICGSNSVRLIQFGNGGDFLGLRQHATVWWYCEIMHNFWPWHANV